MVKVQLFPTTSRMALFTIMTITALVHIIELVAGKTCGRGFNILLIDVTAGTGDSTMPSCQAKLGSIMIKINATPVLFVMAAVTALERLTHFGLFVRTILGVTTVTGMWCLRIFLAGLVTLPTGELAVLTM